MLRPFFSYYGSKWRAGGRVPQPAHGLIVEPFAGSAGYSLRYPHKQVILYDADPVIAGIWDYIIRSSSADILALPDLPPDGNVEDLKVCPEARNLIGYWLNKGVAKPCYTWSKWARNPAFATTCNFWGPGIRQRIASQQPAVRHLSATRIRQRPTLPPVGMWTHRMKRLGTAMRRAARP